MRQKNLDWDTVDDIKRFCGDWLTLNENDSFWLIMSDHASVATQLQVVGRELSPHCDSSLLTVIRASVARQSFQIVAAFSFLGATSNKVRAANKQRRPWCDSLFSAGEWIEIFFHSFKVATLSVFQEQKKLTYGSGKILAGIGSFLVFLWPNQRTQTVPTGHWLKVFFESEWILLEFWDFVARFLFSTWSFVASYFLSTEHSWKTGCPVLAQPEWKRLIKRKWLTEITHHWTHPWVRGPQNRPTESFVESTKVLSRSGTKRQISHGSRILVWANDNPNSERHVLLKTAWFGKIMMKGCGPQRTRPPKKRGTMNVVDSI